MSNIVKEFKYGVNATDMTAEDVHDEVITGVMGYGTDGNGEMIFTDPHRIWLKSAVKRYGYVCKTVDFQQITDKVLKREYEDDVQIGKDALRQILYNKVAKHLKKVNGVVDKKVNVKGIDNFYLGKTFSRIDIGDPVHCYSEAHDIDITATCLSLEIDFFNHANDQYVIGSYIPNNFYDPKITEFEKKENRKRIEKKTRKKG